MIPGVRLVVLGKQGAGKGTQCVRLSHHYVVPQYYSTEFWIAYWNKFGRPEKLAKYQPRGLSPWWIDAEKEKALRSLTGSKQ